MSRVKDVHDMSLFDEESAFRKRYKQRHAIRTIHRRHNASRGIRSDDESDFLQRQRYHTRDVDRHESIPSPGDTIYHQRRQPQPRSNHHCIECGGGDDDDDDVNPPQRGSHMLDTANTISDGVYENDDMAECFYCGRNYELYEKKMWMYLVDQLLTILTILAVGGILLMGFKMIATFIIQLASMQ